MSYAQQELTVLMIFFTTFYARQWYVTNDITRASLTVDDRLLIKTLRIKKDWRCGSNDCGISCQTVETTHVFTHERTYELEMWANAQRDGRLAEYRWCPLFNAAKFGWRPLLECRAVMLPRCETHWNYLECPKLTKRSQPLVGRSSPYCEEVWRRYCCLTSFFSDCRYVP